MTAPSPFLPGTKVQFVWDSTSLGWLKQCPRLYQYQMIEGWRAKGDPVHLHFGLLLHSTLEGYYKLRATGASHDDAEAQVVLDALIATWDPEKGPWTHDLDTPKNRETLVRSIVWYLETFKDDAAETVVLADGRPAVELTFKMELDFGPEEAITRSRESRHHPIVETGFSTKYILSGHIDRLVHFQGEAWVMDHKTTDKTLSANYFDGFKPDNQMTLYTVAAQVIFQSHVRGVFIDAVQVAAGFTRFQRGVTYRTSTEVEEWLADTRRWLRLAEGFAADGYWPMNDKSCKFCSFRKVCSNDPSVRQKMLESDFYKHPWNPLEVRT